MTALRCARVARLRRAVAGDSGSAPVEFVLVGGMLTFLALAVVQLALALHVRATVHDAAAEGARHAALAGADASAGAQRTDALLTAALGAGYAREIEAGREQTGGRELAVVSVRAPLPVIGLLGIPGGLEVRGRAPVESIG